MDLTQVTKLIEAGFTAQEIREMMQGTQQDPQPEPQPEPETKPEPEPQPETKPEPQPDQTEQRLTNIETSISSLLKAIQESNLRNDTQPGAGTKSMQELTDAAMASLINPQGGKDK